MQIAPFDEAFARFRSFLRSHGLPETVVWVFREDLFCPERGTCLVRALRPGENDSLARKVFDEGRAAGLLELKAIGSSAEATIATVWFPRASEEVQGWSEGMKLTIVEPPARARFVGRTRWWFLRFTAAYRRYQRNASFIAKRRQVTV